MSLRVVDDQGAMSAPATKWIEVEAAPAESLFREIGPPRDCDGDGLFEDVNGDGVVDRRDVAALRRLAIKELSAPGQTLADGQQAMFDFDGDGALTLGDVDALEEQVENGTACPEREWPGGEDGEEEDEPLEPL